MTRTLWLVPAVGLALVLLILGEPGLALIAVLVLTFGLAFERDR